MSTRDVGKFDTILTEIVDRIIAEVDGFDVPNCYLSLDAEETPEANPGEFVCVVAPDIQGQFDQGALDGGIPTLGTGVFVGLHSPSWVDQKGRDGVFLADTTKGILNKWRLLVAALNGWSPGQTNSDSGDTRDPLLCSGFYIPKEKRRRRRSPGAIVTRFNLTFDLDLTS